MSTRRISLAAVWLGWRPDWTFGDISDERSDRRLRVEPEARDDNWYLKAAALVVNNDLGLVYWSVDNAPDGLWLGTKSGLVLHLRHYVEPRPVRAEMLETVKMLVRD